MKMLTHLALILFAFYVQSLCALGSAQVQRLRNEGNNPNTPVETIRKNANLLRQAGHTRDANALDSIAERREANAKSVNSRAISTSGSSALPEVAVIPVTEIPVTTVSLAPSAITLATSTFVLPTTEEIQDNITQDTTQAKKLNQDLKTETDRINKDLALNYLEMRKQAAANLDKLSTLNLSPLIAQAQDLMAQLLAINVANSRLKDVLEDQPNYVVKDFDYVGTHSLSSPGWFGGKPYYRLEADATYEALRAPQIQQEFNVAGSTAWPKSAEFALLKIGGLVVTRTPGKFYGENLEFVPEDNNSVAQSINGKLEVLANTLKGLTSAVKNDIYNPYRLAKEQLEADRSIYAKIALKPAPLLSDNDLKLKLGEEKDKEF